MKNIISIPLLVLLFSASGYSQQPTSFHWLAGTWKITLPNGGSVVERWKAANDSTFIGSSSFVKGANDTIPQETLQLIRRNGSWTYISTVEGQNNNQPVVFTVLVEKSMEFVAVNPAHDFPQRIAYRRIGELLYASIEGKKGTRYGKQNFDFKRIP